MAAIFGTTSDSKTTTSTRNSPFAVSGQGVGFYLEKLARYNSPNNKTNIKLAEGASYTVNNVPEGFFESIRSLFGDSGLDGEVQERAAGQIEAGGERAKDEIKTASPSNVIKYGLWAALAFGAFFIIKTVVKGAK